MLQRAAEAIAQQRAHEARGPKIAAVLPARETARAHLGELQRAPADERDRHARQVFEAEMVETLVELAHAKLALARQHIQEPAKHGQRPKREALSAMLREDWLGWFVHAPEFSAGAEG